MFTIMRLNHAVLYVRNAQRAAAFYQDVLGFSVVESIGEGAYFLRANGSDNHHDLGLFGIGEGAPRPGRGDRVGLYHLAWEVATIGDLQQARGDLVNAGALTGQSDHGNSLSLYAMDPDGNEFEVFWMVPREEWESRGFGTRALDLEGELARRGVRRASGWWVAGGSGGSRPASWFVCHLELLDYSWVLRSIHAVFSWTWRRSVSRSTVAWSFASSAVG